MNVNVFVSLFIYIPSCLFIYVVYICRVCIDVNVCNACVSVCICSLVLFMLISDPWVKVFSNKVLQGIQVGSLD